MNDVSSPELLRLSIASGSRILDWLEEGETELATETLHHLIDSLETIERRNEEMAS